MTSHFKLNLSVLTAALLLTAGNATAQNLVAASEKVATTLAEEGGKVVQGLEKGVAKAVELVGPLQQDGLDACRAGENTRDINAAMHELDIIQEAKIAPALQQTSEKLHQTVTAHVTAVQRAQRQQQLAASPAQPALTSEQKRTYAAQQDLLFARVSQGNLHAKYYIGHGKYFNPFEQSILRAEAEGESEILSYLKSPRWLKALEEAEAFANGNDISLLTIEHYVEETMALMFQGRYWSAEPLNEYIIPARYHDDFFNEYMPEILQRVEYKAAKKQEAQRAQLTGTPLVAETEQMAPETTPSAGEEPLSPAEITKLVHEQERVFESIVNERDFHAMQSYFTFRGVKYSPLQQALARAEQEGKTQLAVLLKSRTYRSELYHAFNSHQRRGFVFINKRMMKALGITLKPEDDAALIITDLWMDLTEYVEDTMWKMFLEGRSWTEIPLKNYDIEERFYGLSFREHAEEYLKKIQ